MPRNGPKQRDAGHPWLDLEVRSRPASTSGQSAIFCQPCPGFGRTARNVAESVLDLAENPARCSNTLQIRPMPLGRDW